MVTIHSITETIPPGPNVVQSQINPDPVSSFLENMNPEQPEVVPTLVTPQISVAIETPISHSQQSKIYFGPDSEVLPPGLIAMKKSHKTIHLYLQPILERIFTCTSILLNCFHLLL